MAKDFQKLNNSDFFDNMSSEKIQPNEGENADY